MSRSSSESQIFDSVKCRTVELGSSSLISSIINVLSYLLDHFPFYICFCSCFPTISCQVCVISLFVSYLMHLLKCITGRTTSVVLRVCPRYCFLDFSSCMPHFFMLSIFVFLSLFLKNLIRAAFTFASVACFGKSPGFASINWDWSGEFFYSHYFCVLVSSLFLGIVAFKVDTLRTFPASSFILLSVLLLVSISSIIRII